MPQKKRFNRKDLKPGEVLCEHCTGKCCRYFALPIEKPTSWEDYDHIRWYMMHGSVSIFVDDGNLYLTVHADCKHLLPNNFCGTYETRPQICRDYSTEECEFEDDATHDQLFETPEQIWEYAYAVLAAKPRRTDSEPVSLPVLTVG